jgi:hypothetical protein
MTDCQLVDRGHEMPKPIRTLRGRVRELDVHNASGHFLRRSGISSRCLGTDMLVFSFQQAFDIILSIYLAVKVALTNA